MALPLHDLWQHLQRDLFPMLVEECGPLGAKDHEFVQVVSLLPLGSFLPRYGWVGVGCKPHERAWLLHAFIAKAVYGFPSTATLIENLKARTTLRRLCGWQSAADIPSEATFSRAFAQFAADHLPQQIHDKLIEIHCRAKLVGHISRDATAIEGREKPVRKEKPIKPPCKMGRPKKGEVRPKVPKPVESQLGRTLAENLAALPQGCDVGCKHNSKRHTDWWVGYKLHLDVIDGDIPVSALLTSASVHDCLGAIPLGQMTAQRVTALYELMDSAYDAEAIRVAARQWGHVPIIAPNRHRKEPIWLDPAQYRRLEERSAAERVCSRLKENFGARQVRVRGALKVMAHLTFGLIAVAALGIWARLC